MNDELDVETIVEQRLDAMDERLREQAEDNIERLQEAEFDERVEAEYERLKEQAEENIREEVEKESIRARRAKA